MTNTLHEKRIKLDNWLKPISQREDLKAIYDQGIELSKSLKQWDEDMVQRLSKAYDDVENFPNKFAANYMFLLNATESDIPKVNAGSIHEKMKLDAEWDTLKNRGEDLLHVKLKEFNSKICAAGIGGI